MKNFGMLMMVSGGLVSVGMAIEPIVMEPVGGKFERPIDLQVAPGAGDRLVVVEQDGKIFSVDEVSGERSVMLDLTGVALRAFNEEGLLGLAFAPDFQKSGRFYVNYTFGDKKARDTRISRFVADPKTLVAKKDSEEILFTYKQDFWNHNGGWIAFGPDGLLYIGAGDGGAANDPKARAQDLGNPLGSILRLDVSGEKGYAVPTDNPFVGQEGKVPEIYAYGLRNPWRCSFDSKTGDLWIGDVGQNHWEEVNFVKKGEAKGVNFGWRLREGTHETPKEEVGGERPKKAYEPIYEYGHDMAKKTDGLSITGGYVYRGEREDLQGRYFFADFVSKRVWSITEKDGKLGDFHDHTEELKFPEGKVAGPWSSFGEDEEGGLYVMDLEGSVYRMK
ncbi:MAG: PQQ-dependent sugar dehydrogenase [Verrucomicrobiaceae bacterium]